MRFAIDYDLVRIDSRDYYVPEYARQRPACQAIMNGEYYEPDTHALVERLLKETPGNMVHAGTFYGDMLPSFAGKCPKTVYAFEPVLESYILAKLCLLKNNLRNVALFNAGLGAATSIGHISTHDSHGQHMGGGAHIAEEGQIVTLMTIDSLGLEHLSVIHLDVEGYELPALKGARATIERNHPTLLIEDNAGNCEPFLKNLGYVRVGEIPGLHIWAPQEKAASVRSLLP